MFINGSAKDSHGMFELYNRQRDLLLDSQNQDMVHFISSNWQKGTFSWELGIFVGSSPYFILDVLFRVKSPKTTYTRIYGCYSGLLGGSRIRYREWFVDRCALEWNVVDPWSTNLNVEHRWFKVCVQE